MVVFKPQKYDFINGGFYNSSKTVSQKNIISLKGLGAFTSPFLAYRPRLRLLFYVIYPEVASHFPTAISIFLLHPALLILMALDSVDYYFVPAGFAYFADPSFFDSVLAAVFCLYYFVAVVCFFCSFNARCRFCLASSSMGLSISAFS